LVLKRLKSILKKCRPKSFFAGLPALLGFYPQTSFHHEERDAYTLPATTFKIQERVYITAVNQLGIALQV
jgi:hypothetical protein